MHTGNRTRTYVSTEGELAVKEFEQGQTGQVKKKVKKTQSEITTSKSAVKKQEKFEEVKKKDQKYAAWICSRVCAGSSGCGCL